MEHYSQSTFPALSSRLADDIATLTGASADRIGVFGMQEVADGVSFNMMLHPFESDLPVQEEEPTSLVMAEAVRAWEEGDASEFSVTLLPNDVDKRNNAVSSYRFHWRKNQRQHRHS